MLQRLFPRPTLLLEPPLTHSDVEKLCLGTKEGCAEAAVEAAATGTAAMEEAAGGAAMEVVVVVAMMIIGAAAVIIGIVETPTAAVVAVIIGVIHIMMIIEGIAILLEIETATVIDMATDTAVEKGGTVLDMDIQMHLHPEEGTLIEEEEIIMLEVVAVVTGPMIEDQAMERIQATWVHHRYLGMEHQAVESMGRLLLAEESIYLHHGTATTPAVVAAVLLHRQHLHQAAMIGMTQGPLLLLQEATAAMLLHRRLQVVAMAGMMGDSPLHMTAHLRTKY